MPAARYWRLVAIEAHGGADLELSALHLYDAAGRADSTSTLTSTIAPTAGTLAALQDEDLASTCRFAAAAVRASGFAIVWDLGAGITADIIGPRLAGPALATFLASCTLQCSDDGLLWQWVADFARFDWPGAAAYTNAPAAGGDPHFDKVSLLLHMDGADGSTAFTDNSQTPKTVTANGNAKISTAQSKFGGAGAYFDGTGDCLSLPENTAFGFGLADFTVEAWIYITGGNGADRGITDFRKTGGNDVGTFFIDGPAGNRLAFWYGSKLGGTGKSLSLNVWYHVALSRANGVFRCYVGGVQDWSSSASVNFGASRPLGIGGAADGGAGLVLGSSPFFGYIDEVRITKGVARYTADFVPPTTPFPNAVGGAVPAAPRLRAPTPERARIAASAPVPPHSTLSAPRLLTARNVEFAGTGTASATGTIYGSTAIKGSPNAPVRAKVSLLRARDLLLVQQTWSDPTTGAYAFHGLDPFEKYTTLAEYPTGDYRAVAADQLTPDIEEARAP